MQSRTSTILIGLSVSLLFCVFLAAPISAVLIRSHGTRPETHSYDSRQDQSFSNRLGSSIFKSRTDLALTTGAPSVSSLSPSSAIAGGPGFSLSVNGADFVDGFVIRVDGVDRTTNFVDATQLSTTIGSTDIAAAGSFAVTVFDPDPSGGESAPETFAINNGVPTSSALSPASATVGGAAFTLTITGSKFVGDTTVNFGGTIHTADVVLVDATHVSATIAASEIDSAGPRSVTVTNPAPGGGTSPPLSFAVNNPLPITSALSPTSATVGGAAFTLTITGSKFISGTTVNFGGTIHAADVVVVDATHVSAAITASEIASAGPRSVTVTNPGPGGGTSTSALSFAVNNPLPITSALLPTSATVGGAAFTLTITGSNFVSGTTVNFGGTIHTADVVVVDATNVTANIAMSEIASAGPRSVTVTNPGPGGGASTPALSFTVNNPLPIPTTLSPTSVTVGGAAFTLTVNGTNFVSGATVLFGAITHAATFVNSTRLTTSIAASEIITASILSVTVTNPTPGGGASTSSLSFAVNNPVPTVSTPLSPTSKMAGEPAFTLTVNGTNFRSSSVVRVNGIARTTTLVSATRVTAQILASDIAANGNVPITVFNPLPGGGSSNAVNLVVSQVPVPTITTAIGGLSPNSATAGGPSFTLTVNGTNFVNLATDSVVRFNGNARTTTFVSATRLTATIPAADIGIAGSYPITVLNPGPGGGASNSVNLTVSPTMTSISPATVRAGGLGFPLTVGGAGFASGSIVRFNGTNRSTTFISSTQLRASIVATDLLTAGAFPITVITAGGLISNAVNLTVIPAIIGLTPLTAGAGDPPLELTVTGSGFVTGAVVKWAGVAKPTTFVNATKLTAAITAADIAFVGSFPVTVLNPAPTNLASDAINFAVTTSPPATECAAGPDVTLANPGLINGGPARAQMWRNDNTWWGAFSNNTDGIYFYQQTTPTTWAQGALIDTNVVLNTFVAGSPDCLWDGTNLFVLIQESTLVAKLYKYTYATDTKTYPLVAGFPVSLPLIGVGTSSSGKPYGTLAIDQDSTGKLWAAYSGSGIGGDGNVRVISSTSADHTAWDTTGVILASGVSTLNTEGTTILHFGTKTGVAWSNETLSEDGFRYHIDGALATAWSTKEVIDSGLGPEGTGSVAGKQMTMKATPDGRIFFVGSDNDGLNSHLHLYIRTAAGIWGQKTLVVNDFAAAPGKPVLLIDTDNSVLHVIYKDGAIGPNGLGGQTFITQSSMNNPAFNTACLLIDTSDSLTSTSNPTSTKQNVDATTDLLVACSTGRKGNTILVNSLDVTPHAVRVFSLSPKEVTAGEAALMLTVSGKLFSQTPSPGSRINLNGIPITSTTFVNAGRLTGLIPNTDIATVGSYPISVINPDNTVSNAVGLVVTAQNPAPTVIRIAPKRELVGTAQFTMTVSGGGFRRSSVVRFNGVDRATTFVSDTTLTATILASDLLVPGPFPITVFNPLPGGGTSAVTKPAIFFVEPPCVISVPQSFPGITVWNTNKAQMWYNDGLWWGAFSDNAAGVFFYKQSGMTFTQGALLDGNYNGHPDVIWNGFNLFVLVYELSTQAKLYKYTYNSTTKLYSVVAGFPITMPLIGIGTGTTLSQSGSITMAQDSTGKLWAAYPGTGPGGDTNFRVIWSTSADQKVWDTDGFILDTGGSTITQEVESIVPFGGNKIGVTWSNQVALELGFRYHNDGAPENVWSTKEIIDFGLGNEQGIGGVADNHESIKAAPDGRIFLVQKDSDGNGNLHLYIRSTAGVWSANPILINIDPQAMPTRPTLLLDLENNDVYVVYDDATQSLSYLSHTSMTTPSFGPSCPFVSLTFIDNLTSTKQNLNASMGFMAVGSTSGATSVIYSNAETLAPASGNLPVLSSLSQSTVGVNGPPLTLTINGANFATDAVVYFNGMDRPTTFVSPTRLSARIFASDIANLGTFSITVMNPRGGTSVATANLAVTVSASISSLSPASATVGGPAFTLTVNGAGFANGATVNFNGVPRAATVVNATLLTTQILATEIQTFGTLPVTVVNPGGAASPAGNFLVNNTVPTLSGISPAIRVVGSGAFTLTATGTNFNGSSVLNFNGLPRATTFVSTTQLTATILLSDVGVTGTFPIAVSNPAPGGGISATLPLSVINPLPSIASFSPTVAIVGAGGLTLTVDGSGFINGSVVRFNGSDRPTSFVNATKLTVQTAAADLLAPGSFPITVFNPAPGGGTSAPGNLSVINLVPSLSGISPSSSIAGDAAFTLTVNGTNFNGSSIVRFNGSDRTTTLVNATQLTIHMTAADVAAAGTFPIAVFNPAPGGGLSNTTGLTVNNATPMLTSISPTSATQGAAAFVLTVNGTSFNSASIVRLGGADRPTTLVNSTQLTAQLTVADVQAAGAFPIAVFNPAPGGGTSNAIDLTVNNPVPALIELLPASKTAGDAAFVLTVNGSNFNNSSKVRLAGADRPTTLVNATQLTAQLTAVDVAAAGTTSITVFNSLPGGGQSINALNLTVNNPVPTVSGILPATKTAGDGAFVLTVNGANFNDSSKVRLGSADRPTTFVNATQVTAQITAAEVHAAGIFPITVFNPAPGGGTTNALDLIVNNPIATVSTLSPASKTAGDALFVLTVNGANFVDSSVVEWNGSSRPTTFVSAAQLTAQITGADLETAGTFLVSVFNPTPGGGTSGAMDFVVNNPAPTLVGISSTSATAGAAAFTLTANGNNFSSNSIVRFSGSDRPTTFVSSSQLTAQITAAELAAAGLFPITVFTPAPGGGTSNAIDLTVNNPVPAVTELLPASKTAGDAAFVLTVNGTNFNGSSSVRFNGGDRATTLVNATQLTAQLTSADLATAGNYSIVVFNPAPGGGVSISTVNFTVNNPIPTVNTLTPHSMAAGDSAFTLTVNGTSFVNTSVLQWDGQPRSTTFVSATQLMAEITAADVAAAGTAAITVFNPTPGGGISNAVPLTVRDRSLLRAVNSSGASNSTVTVPIQITAQGDETAVAFSLTFDTALLLSSPLPQVTLGSDAVGATLVADTTQVAQGLLGISLTLPVGQSFAAGVRELATVTFTTATVVTETVTPVGFGDQPVLRVVTNAIAEALPAAYNAGAATLTIGYEADVFPRPNGSNTGIIGISDWVQVGRFASGLDTPDLGSEFQRADCAPKLSIGDGRITIQDWVQAGRYAAGLDLASSAGGQTGPLPAVAPPSVTQTDSVKTTGANGVEAVIAQTTTVNLVSTIMPVGQSSSVSIEFEAQGNENAFGFSLMFDPAKLSFVSAEKSNEASGATLNVNKLEAVAGRVGIALALPAGTTLALGRHQLVVLTFALRRDSSELPLISFTDLPIAREVVDLNANGLKAVFKDASGANPLDTQFFITQPYLDFLNRIPNNGLDYSLSGKQPRSGGMFLALSSQGIQNRLDDFYKHFGPPDLFSDTLLKQDGTLTQQKIAMVKLLSPKW